MDHAEAVRLAMTGDERGFRFLYDTTYQSKFYLALQYMRNEGAAEDVMQEAYLRAFSRLDMLKEPAAFEQWLGRIVANTAKNMLKQKKPMLFADIDPNEDGLEYQIEDMDIGNQPELAYTRQETQELVHRLIDSLSPEQRMCILMFHIEGMPIRMIADALDCSENTVKSRLNYGRKNLRIKAEELQKKGYKLYSAAPVALLIYLLYRDRASMAAEGALAGSEKIWKQTHKVIKRQIRTGAKMAGNASKAGVLHTVAGQMMIGALIGCLIGGVAYFGASQLLNMNTPQPGSEEMSENTQDDTVSNSLAEDQDPEGTKPTETPGNTEDEEMEDTPTQMADADYPRMIAGNLTKEELEAVLAYGPQTIPGQGFSDSDYLEMMNAFCNISFSASEPVAYHGFASGGRSQYSLSDVNRLFASFTDFAYTEDNDADTEYGVNVEGDMLIYSPATINYTAEARILSAEYTEEEMQVYFTYSNTRTGQTDVSKTATLRPLENGLYRITRIEEGTPDGGTQAPADTAQEDVGTGSVMDAYDQVLKAVQAQEPGYDFSDVPTRTGVYRYFTHDMDGDGIEELIVGAEAIESVFYVNYCRIYTCEKTGSGYTARPCAGELSSVLALHLPGDGNGLFRKEFSRGTGETDIYRVTLDQDQIVVSSSPEYQYIMGDANEAAFIAANPEPGWRDVADH